MSQLRQFAGVVGLLLSWAALADGASGESQSDAWYDSGHELITDSADAAAQWIDSFFGEERADVEAASSRLRVRFESRWDEEDGHKFDLKLRGKLNLPLGERRLSLVFEGEESDAEFDSAAFSTDEDSSIALQYRLWDEIRQRIDLSAGVKAGPKGKFSARYRIKQPFADKNLVRLTEEVFWVGGEGFGNLARLDVDRALTKDRLLRWTNRALYAEESDGVEWRSRLQLRQRLNEKTAVGCFAVISGETDPSVLTRAYGLGVTFRRNFLRRWLFAEVEPAYYWRKEGDGGNRFGSAVLLLRLEVALDERFRAARNEDSSDDEPHSHPIMD